jgi:hypothetical protein
MGMLKRSRIMKSDRWRSNHCLARNVAKGTHTQNFFTKFLHFGKIHDILLLVGLSFLLKVTSGNKVTPLCRKYIRTWNSSCDTDRQRSLVVIYFISKCYSMECDRRYVSESQGFGSVYWLRDKVQKIRLLSNFKLLSVHHQWFVTTGNNFPYICSTKPTIFMLESNGIIFVKLNVSSSAPVSVRRKQSGCLSCWFFGAVIIKFPYFLWPSRWRWATNRSSPKKWLYDS